MTWGPGQLEALLHAQGQELLEPGPVLAYLVGLQPAPPAVRRQQAGGLASILPVFLLNL